MIGARKLPICAPLSIIPIQVPYTLVGKSSVKYITKTVKTKAEYKNIDTSNKPIQANYNQLSS
jgi:hypothetical protein